jgi:predicted hydrocarbon binding protein
MRELLMVNHNDAKIPNSQLRITLIAMQQVIGEDAAQDILNNLDLGLDLEKLPPDDNKQTFSARNFAALLAEIDRSYAARGARILVRIGRATFHQVLREQPNWMSTARKTMSIWKSSRRIELMLEAIIDAQGETLPQGESWIEHRNGQISIIDQNCRVCCGLESETPICHLRTGFLSEAVNWSTGKEFNLVETACIAAGDPYCRYSVDISKPPSKASASPSSFFPA